MEPAPECQDGRPIPGEINPRFFIRPKKKVRRSRRSRDRRSVMSLRDLDTMQEKDETTEQHAEQEGDESETRRSNSSTPSNSSESPPSSLRKTALNPFKNKKRTVPKSVVLDFNLTNTTHSRFTEYRRSHLRQWDFKTGHGKGVYPLPMIFASPSDHCLLKRFKDKKWVGGKWETYYPPEGGFEEVPETLEILALSDHMYVQRCLEGDFPDHSAIQLHLDDVERYHVMCGDTRNRMFYAVAQYPGWSGLLRSQRPYRIHVFNNELEIMFQFGKPMTWAVWLGVGGYGTKIGVTGPKGEALGTIVQRWERDGETWYERWYQRKTPIFDIFDNGERLVFIVKGPPIVPFPHWSLYVMERFKLYEVEEEKFFDKDPSGNMIGIFLESAFGVGFRNSQNCLKVGYPRELPYQHKGLIMGILFHLFVTYYELGHHYARKDKYRQYLRPTILMSPWSGMKLRKPYGFPRGRYGAWWHILLGFIIFCVTMYYGAKSNFRFNLASTGHPKFANQTPVYEGWWPFKRSLNAYD